MPDFYFRKIDKQILFNIAFFLKEEDKTISYYILDFLYNTDPNFLKKSIEQKQPYQTPIIFIMQRQQQIKKDFIHKRTLKVFYNIYKTYQQTNNPFKIQVSIYLKDFINYAHPIFINLSKKTDLYYIPEFKLSPYVEKLYK